MDEEKESTEVNNEGCPHTKELVPLKKIIKLGRNNPCHCGSGLKYKNCCYEQLNDLYNRSIYKV